MIRERSPKFPSILYSPVCCKAIGWFLYFQITVNYLINYYFCYIFYNYFFIFWTKTSQVSIGTMSSSWTSRWSTITVSKKWNIIKLKDIKLKIRLIKYRNCRTFQVRSHRQARCHLVHSEQRLILRHREPHTQKLGSRQIRLERKPNLNTFLYFQVKRSNSKMK